MTAAGEWLPRRPLDDVEHQGDETPAAPSLAAGAIARSLSNAGESHGRSTLALLIADAGPWDD